MGKSGQVIPILFAFEREREEEKIHHRLLAEETFFSAERSGKKRSLPPSSLYKGEKSQVRRTRGRGSWKKKLGKADKSGYEEEEANCRGSSLGENVDQSNL